MRTSCLIAILFLVLLPPALRAADDPIQTVQRKLADGTLEFDVHDQRGYLDSLLSALHISETSQVVVFSKTSFQSHLIFPEKPRAMYFNDHTYVGFVHNGLIEIATVDPEEGLRYYSIDNTFAARLDERAKQPAELIEPGGSDCFDCHGQTSENRVSRLLVRSVFTDDDGFPMLPFGSFATTHQSPLKQRWGGWYVTGSTGDQTTMANTRYERGDPQKPKPLAETKPQVERLSELFDSSSYLTDHSDVVALMVLEHQAGMHNRIHRARHDVLRALKVEETARSVHAETGNPALHSESTIRQVRASCEPLVEAMLMSGEPVLTSPIVGSSSFSEHFGARGPRDSKTRSLRQLDLQTRLFKYPCSYMIYTDAFKSLPPLAVDYIRMRLTDILAGKDESAAFGHLSAADRTAIREILHDTAPELLSE